MNLEQVQAIPGMIEPVEQKMLYDIVSNVELSPNDAVVEFGTFLGRSTNCLAQGLIANQFRDKSNKIYAYDSFQCHKEGGFSSHLLGFAKSGNSDHLIKEKGHILDFKNVFEFYNQSYIDEGVLCAVQEELTNSHPPHGEIAFMHIDSPKYYGEFKTILFRFFPYLQSNSMIVFQDYFYHWSASLIAAVIVMKNIELISLEKSAATSLLVKLLRKPTLEDITEIDLFMNEPSRVALLLEQAIDECSDILVDRPEEFIPRVYLALFQNYWDSGDYEKAKNLVVRFFNDGFKLNQSVVNDYIEMLGHGFSVRKLYKKDHELGEQ